MIEFTIDEPVNHIDPEMPNLDDISENVSSDHENVVSDHEEEMEIESPDEAELPPRTRKPPRHLQDYVIGREAEENELQNILTLFNTSFDPS